MHIPLVLTAALLPLLGEPLPYLPMVIVLLELAIHPLALLAFQQAGSQARAGPAPRGSRIFGRVRAAWLLAGGLLATLLVATGWFLRIGDSTELARAMAAGLLIALAVGSAAGLSGLRGPLARRVIALVAIGGFGLLSWPSAAALLEVAPLDASALLPIAGMLLAAAVGGTAMRHSETGGRG